VEIKSHFAGTPLKEYRADLHWRDVMNYAAAVEDPNPHYLDDERPDGIVAPPMFCVAVTWPILERIWEYIQADDFPHHLIPTQVHYTEHLEFHRPIKPGDSLTITGKIAAILPHKSGTHIVVRLDACGKDGTWVFTEHIGALMRGVECLDGGRGKDTLPSIPSAPDDHTIIWEAAIPVDPLRPYVYDGCTGIFFPIHTSKQFAHQVGLPGIILQGTATLAFAVRELVNREAAGNPLLLQSLYCRFTGMVLPDTEIRVQLIRRTLKENGTDLYFVVRNQDGRKVISSGYAFLKKQPGKEVS
jgi:acyl dehydratase